MSDEAHLSAQQARACAPAWLFRAQGDRRRPQGVGRAPRPWPQSPLRLIHLRKRADFLAANRGKRAAMPGFVLLARDRGDGDDAVRVGYTVTKKIGNAVVRNRMKRRLREIARAELPGAGRDGCDYVLIGREGGIERDFSALRGELAKALAKVAR